MGEHDEGPGTAGAPFLFEANSSALDLVNTEMMLDGARADLLPDAAALTRWLAGASLPADGVTAAALQEAKRLRGALREIAGALADGEPVADSALRVLNGLIGRRTGHEQVGADGEGGYARLFHDTSPPEVRLLAPIMEAAVRLLTAGERAHVRRCGNPDCILFFLDTSKSHTRRWCSMGLCGNRAKAAAHYARVRERRKGRA